MVAEVYPARDPAATASEHAHLMAAFLVICALPAAFAIGYHFGRITGRKGSPTRTGRASFGRTAVRLVAFMAATHVQRSLQRKLATEWPNSVMAPVTVAKRLAAIARSTP
ncbi:MAG: hypothetical protein ACM4D3_11360 [Candidatus Sericytochromatia bacterium]